MRLELVFGGSNIDKLNVENEDGIWRNYVAKTFCAIRLFGWDGELPLLALDHTKEAFVPALDNLANAESHVERRSAIDRGVKLCASGEECSSVVDGDGITRFGFRE